jgi:hypothetical protein
VSEPLQQVLAVREAHLQTMQMRLADVQRVLDDIDEEVAAIDRDLGMITEQRATWEREWQHWLRHDRVLRHGQDYGLMHMALSIWQQDTQEARAEIWRRREAAANEVDAARAVLLGAQLKADALRQKLREMQKLHQARVEAVLDERMGEEVTSRWRMERFSKEEPA